MSLRPFYSEAGITIYHGDCREVLPQLECGADCVILDPNFEDWSEFSALVPHDQPEFLLTFSRQPTTTKLIIGFSLAYEFRECLIWHDPQPIWVSDAMALKTHEEICVFRAGTHKPAIFAGELNGAQGGSKGSSSIGRWKPATNHIYAPRARKQLTSVLIYPRDLSSELGRWQKPLPLMACLLRAFCQQTVLDPFMGSGTTLRAAKDLGLEAVGIEIEEKHCEVAAQRLSQMAFRFSD